MAEAAAAAALTDEEDATVVVRPPPMGLAETADSEKGGEPDDAGWTG